MTTENTQALREALGIAYELTRPEPKMSGPHYRTIGPVTAQRIHEAIKEAAVRAETLAGSGVVEALRKHHRHTVRVVLMADDSASLWCRSCDQYLIAATPPTPRAAEVKR